jgi:hypothetical protein
MQVNAFANQQQQQEQALSKVRSERYSEIMGHEQAHQSAAGGFAGGITINYDKNGVAVSGSVPISIPAMDIYNPSKSLAAGNIIRTAALAPCNPSSADKRVAGIASGLIAKAQDLISTIAKTISFGKAIHSIKPHNPFL